MRDWGEMDGVDIEVIAHEALTSPDLEGLRRIFDEEYLSDFGPWNPAQPYGYAPHETHVIARLRSQIVGHVGWARREVSVGDAQVTIAGTGGVLVAKSARGAGLGFKLMLRASETMRSAGGIQFGYLGCREEVARFYVSCGWHRINAPERFVGRDGKPSESKANDPLLILPVEAALANWPTGPIDLRGRAW